jgi:hypothetical protein
MCTQEAANGRDSAILLMRGAQYVHMVGKRKREVVEPVYPPAPEGH